MSAAAPRNALFIPEVEGAHEIRLELLTPPLTLSLSLSLATFIIQMNKYSGLRIIVFPSVLVSA